MVAQPRQPTRVYYSPRRTAAARQTREAILSAARSLFVEQGYVATTIEKIAERAGVSKPTVFAAIGPKRAIFKELRDVAVAGDDLAVPVVERPWYREALDEADPARSLRLHARNMVRMHERYANLHGVLRAGAGADEELRELWNTSERERRVGAAYVIDALVTKGPLKPGLDKETAVDLLWVLTSSETFQRLVNARGWSTEQYETWLAQTFIEQLLPEGARQGDATHRPRDNGRRIGS